MATATISMQLDADTALMFEQAPKEDKDKLCLLWSVLVREYEAAPGSLRSLMDQIGNRARQRGLTAEKLESILDGA